MVQIQRIPVGDLSSPFKRLRFYAAQRFIPDQNGVVNAEDRDYRVERENGPKIPLSQGAIRQQALDSIQLENFVTELSAEIHNSQTAMLSITMTPPFLDAVQIIENRLIRRDSIIVAQWGYSSKEGANDKISRPFVFIALEPEIDVSSTEITITIKGMDVLGMALAQNEQRRRWDRKGGFASDLQIIEELARRQGLTVNLDKLRFSNSLYENKFDPEAIEQTQNDWVFFQELLKRNNAGYVLIGTEVFLFDEGQTPLEQPLYRLRFYDQMEDEFDIPMVSFNANPIGAYFSSGETKSVVARTTNMDKNEILEEKHDAQQDETLTHAERQSQAGDKNRGEGVKTPEGTVKPTPVTESNAAGVHVSLSPDKHSREELGKQIMRIGADKANTHAKVSAVGVPFIIPHIMILVDCGIPSFSGKYFVQKVTHTIGTNGYDMELELLRRGMGQKNANTKVPVGQKNRYTEKGRNTRTPEPTESQP